MNASAFSSWQLWAVLSAVFAALTAIFAKIGVENVNSDLATFIRTIVVVAVLGLIVFATRQFQNPAGISGRTYLFLGLSGLGTGASWLCYFRALKLGDVSKVAPVDKLSVAIAILLAVLFLGEKLRAQEAIGAALIVLGASDMISVYIRQTLVQIETPDEMRGRVSAVNTLFIGASNQLGEFESGAVASMIGAVGSVVVGGVGTLVVVALWMNLFPRLRDRDNLT